MLHLPSYFSFFFFNDTATTEIYTLSLHDALPILPDEPNGIFDRFLVLGNRASYRFYAHNRREVRSPVRARGDLESQRSEPSVPSRRRKTLPALFQAGLLAFHHQRERGVARRHLKPIGRGVRRDLLQREPHADGLAAHFALCVPGPRVALHGPSGEVVLTEVI